MQPQQMNEKYNNAAEPVRLYYYVNVHFIPCGETTKSNINLKLNVANHNITWHLAIPGVMTNVYHFTCHNITKIPKLH